MSEMPERILEAVGELKAMVRDSSAETERMRNLVDFMATSVQTQDHKVDSALGAVGKLAESMDKLSAEVHSLTVGFAEQQARVESFWKNGKGAEWEGRIAANEVEIRKLVEQVAKLEASDAKIEKLTEVVEALNAKLSDLETDGKVSKAKALGVLAGAGAAGGGLAKLVEALL